MKLLIALMSLGMLNFAWADCANLSGSWLCEDQEGETTAFNLEKSEKTFIFSDAQGNEILKVEADGVVRDTILAVPDESGLVYEVPVKEKATCDEKGLVIETYTAPDQSGLPLLQLKEELLKKEGDLLEYITIVQVEGQESRTLKSSCSRLQ